MAVSINNNQFSAISNSGIGATGAAISSENINNGSLIVSIVGNQGSNIDAEQSFYIGGTNNGSGSMVILITDNNYSGLHLNNGVEVSNNSTTANTCATILNNTVITTPSTPNGVTNEPGAVFRLDPSSLGASNTPPLIESGTITSGTCP